MQTLSLKLIIIVIVRISWCNFTKKISITWNHVHLYSQIEYLNISTLLLILNAWNIRVFNWKAVRSKPWILGAHLFLYDFITAKDFCTWSKVGASGVRAFLSTLAYVLPAKEKCAS